MHSPLEQFSIFVIYPFNFWNFDLSITSINLVFIFIILSFFFTIIINFSSITLFNFSFFQNILEFFYNFVKELMYQQTNKKNIPYVPLAFTIFLFILVFNFAGITSITPTLTSQFAITASLAVSVNFGFLLLAFQLQGFKFLKFFVPAGIPVFLIPLMTIIELFSYSIRSISLFVRLFANMMAGHTLMHIISSFFLVLFLSFNYYVAFIPFFLLVSIYFLELAVAFLQAYVFLTLFCIYLNDAVHGSHLF